MDESEYGKCVRVVDGVVLGEVIWVVVGHSVWGWLMVMGGYIGEKVLEDDRSV